MDRVTLLQQLYPAFNARDVERLLGVMTEDVDWPNGWEGGWISGRDAVAEYWRRQWAEIDPVVEAVGFTERAPGVIAVDVDQTVRSLDGGLLSEDRVVHVYTFDGDRVARMEIEAPASGT
jgi:ketosteroid isomerase-like protein